MSRSIDGALVVLLVNMGTEQAPSWVAVGEQTGLSISETRNLIEANSKDTDHEDFLYGKAGGTLTLDALYVPNDAAAGRIRGALRNKERLKVRRTEDGVHIEEAEVLIESIDRDFPDNAASTMSVTLRLSTAFAPITV